MKILCVIPSRLASTRLPRKSLALIQGTPMVQRVYEQAKKCALLTEVIVATDSEEIASVIKDIGGKVAMTDPALKTGSDRVAAVAKAYPDMEVVINLQGDEPFIQPQMLEELIAPYLAGEKPDMTTLAYDLDFNTEYEDPNIVKVITNQLGHAIYFSRSPIPYNRAVLEKLPVWHHMGLYAYTREFLQIYQSLLQTPLEQAESLEQLRALEHGYVIRVCHTAHRTLEINTPEELARAQTFPLIQA